VTLEPRKMPPLRWLSFALFGLAAAAGGGLLLQRQASEALRGELELVREENGALARLRAEHERLAAAQPTAAELARLREDRAALVRLRDEIEKLKQRADSGDAEANRLAAKPLRSPPPPAATVTFGVGTDGRLSLDDTPLEPNAVRQHLAGFVGKADRVEIHLEMPADPRAQADDMKRNIESVFRMAQELGLKTTVRFDRPRQ
jgi:hypothetical protein